MAGRDWREVKQQRSKRELGISIRRKQCVGMGSFHILFNELKICFDHARGGCGKTNQNSLVEFYLVYALFE